MLKRTMQIGMTLSLSAALGCASGGSGEPAPAEGPATADTPPAAQPAQPTVDAVAASFSSAQAGGGQDVFNNSCSACHAISDFRGRTFLYGWRQRTALDLYGQIFETMPEDSPGSLQDEEYVNVVAYILSQNGHRAGDGDLAATEESMGQLPVDASETGAENPAG